MPVPGNEEPGVLSLQLQQQQQQQQSSNFSGAIPIKKRRFPVIRPPSPSPEEKCFSSEDNGSMDKKDSISPDRGLSISAAKDMDYPSKIDGSKTFDLIVKKNQVTNTHVEMAQANVDISASKTQEANPGIRLGLIDNLRNKQNILLNEKYADPEVSGSSVTHILNVKQEIVSGKLEGTCELELSPGSKNVGLFFGAKEPFVPALEHKISEGIGQMSGKSELSLLSLSLSQEKLVSQKNNSTVSDVSSRVCANRSNWDLNTTMDVWEGSVSNDAFAHKIAGIGGLNKTNMGGDGKSSLSAASIVVRLNKGKQILDEHSSNSSNSSAQPSQQFKPDDILGLSLAMPCRELDASGELSSLSDNIDFDSFGPNSYCRREQLSTVNLTFASVRNVKSEPVDENSKRDCSTGNSSNMVLSKLGSVKREFFDNHGSKTVLRSSISPQKLVDHISIKSELVQECNKETCKSADAKLSQSIGKIMQHQESSASSSVFSIPLTPQNSCPSRFSTCLELPISGDLSNQSEHSLPHKELHDHRDIPDERSDAMVSNSVSENGKQLRLCKTENLNIQDAGKGEMVLVDEQSHELCGNSEVAANDEEKINISAEMLEEDSFGSDCESYGNHAFATHMDVEEKLYEKEDEEYEDGEVREPLKHSIGEDAMVEDKKTENVVLVERDCRNVQSTDFLIEQSTNASDFDGKPSVTEKNDETSCDQIKGLVVGLNELKSEDKSLQKPLLDKVAEVGTDEKKSISVTPEKPLDLTGSKNVSKGHEKEMSTATNESGGIGITLDGDVTDKVVKEICPGEHDSTLSKVEASVNGNDAVKDSNSVANKSRIINLPRASVVATPGKTRSLSSRLLTSRTGKERYSDLDRDIHPRGNRDELYIDGPNKFVKDRVHDQSFRNSRLSFMLGKGRVTGRFGPLQNEWDSDHDYAPETYNSPADYRVGRHKHASSTAVVELECNGYGITPDGTSLSSSRRKTMNAELHSLRRPPFRRLSPGDREGPVPRGIQMPRRFLRNISPSRCIVEDGSDFVGLRHGDKFMGHLSDDVMDPVFSRSQTIYDELDGQLVRGNRNFSAVHRKGYPRIHSKSPVRSRTRSPGPWLSPRQRSPTGLPELTQHRSPVLYRMGRMRSPDRACYRNEMVPRRRASPSYIARHTNDLRDLDSGRDHVHPRPVNSNRRSPPGRLFPRNSSRGDVLGSRERADVDEYSNGPVHSNKFQELRSDGSMDERRKFSERRGLIHSFRPSYSGDNGNYQFHLNDAPRPYRFCQDTDTEFVERSNMRERVFDGHIKHPSLIVSRRIRNIEDQQDGNHRPSGRVWHEDGFSDVSRVKRRRF